MKNLKKSTFLMFRELLRKFMIIAGGFYIGLDVIQFKIFLLVSRLKTGLQPLMCKLLSSRNSYPKWRTHSSAKSAWTRRLTQCFVHVDTWSRAVSVQQISTCVLFAEGRLNVHNTFFSQLLWVELGGDTKTSASNILHSEVFKVPLQTTFSCIATVFDQDPKGWWPYCATSLVYDPRQLMPGKMWARPHHVQSEAEELSRHALNVFWALRWLVYWKVEVFLTESIVF